MNDEFPEVPDEWQHHEEVFFHFPPVPTCEPRRQAMPKLHPPKSRPLTESELAAMHAAARVQAVLDCNDSCRLFGFVGVNDATLTRDSLAAAKKRLLVFVHPDKHRELVALATAAVLKVQAAFAELESQLPQ